MPLRTAATNRYSILGNTKSLDFNGTNSLATVPITPSVTGFSLGLWIRKSNESGVYIHWKTASTTDGFSLFRASGNRINMQMHNSTNLIANIASDSGTFGQTGFYFVCITYKVNEVKMFLNGVQAATTDTNATMSDATGQSLTLCRNSYTSSGFAAAKMCNFTFQNTTTPWTTTQMDALRFKNKIPSGALQWSMNNVATDQNGENPLTLTNTSYSTDIPSHFPARTVRP